MKFKTQFIPGLLPVLKAGSSITLTIRSASKVTEGVKKLIDADLESGVQITFIDPKSILNNHLKSLRLKN